MSREPPGTSSLRLIETIGFWWSLFALIYSMKTVQQLVSDALDWLHIGWRLDPVIPPLMAFGFFLGARFWSPIVSTPLGFNGAPLVFGPICVAWIYLLESDQAGYWVGAEELLHGALFFVPLSFLIAFVAGAIVDAARKPRQSSWRARD